MTSTLKGAEDMATLKIFKRYFKLKNEITDIEKQVKTLGFKNVEECFTLFILVENQKAMLKTELVQKTEIHDATLSRILIRLDSIKLVKQSNDKTDTSDRPLKRQIYTPTQAGIDLIEQLKQQLQ